MKRIDMLNARLGELGERLPRVEAWAAGRERERARAAAVVRAFAAEEHGAGLEAALGRAETTAASLRQTEQTLAAVPGAAEGRRRAQLAQVARTVGGQLLALRPPDCGPWLARLAALGARVDRAETALRALPAPLALLQRYARAKDSITQIIKSF